VGQRIGHQVPLVAHLPRRFQAQPAAQHPGQQDGDPLRIVPPPRAPDLPHCAPPSSRTKVREPRMATSREIIIWDRQRHRQVMFYLKVAQRRAAPANREVQMPRYLVEAHASFLGLNRFTVEHHEELVVGQSVTLTPTQPVTFTGASGQISMGPGVTFSATVVAKL
jgi:hypothetical protein